MTAPAEDYEPRADHELALVAGLVLEPEQIDGVLEILRTVDVVVNPKLRLVLKSAVDLHGAGHDVTLPGIAADLAYAGRLEEVGGTQWLGDLFESEVNGAHVLAHARELRRLEREYQIRRLYTQASIQGSTPALRAEIEAAEAALSGVQQNDLHLVDAGFTGERLRALAQRPQRTSPLPGYLDSEPTLSIGQGAAKSGKTRHGLVIAMAWCRGMPPWEGAPNLPGSRALILSAEQSAVRIERTCRQLSGFAHRPTGHDWTRWLTIIGRDRELPPEGRRLLTLDAEGQGMLRSLLLRAADAGDPYGFVLLDSLSRLKPHGAEENSNDHMTDLLAPLLAIAEETECYFHLVHHTGHDPTRTGAVGAGRGASAISAVPQVVWLLDRVTGEPRQRVLKVAGNDVLEGEHYFEVAGEDADPGAVFYFRPSDPLAKWAAQIDQLIGAGEKITTRELAWRVAGRRPRGKKDRPPARAGKTATALRERWESESLVTIEPGPRNSTLIGRTARRRKARSRGIPSSRSEGHRQKKGRTLPTLSDRDRRAASEFRGAGELSGSQDRRLL